jgi:hypothetical protein
MDRLDKSTIETFHLVTGHNNKDATQVESEDTVKAQTIKRVINEGSRICLILCSAGHDPFLLPQSEKGAKPPLIVALAHHISLDAFLLFALSPQAVPCRLARFQKDSFRFLWSKSDAAALVKAVEIVEKGFDSGYFCKVDDVPDAHSSDNATAGG